MVEALIVNQFRCFRQVQLLGLGRVNVLVGDSGSGKTALLEAVYMAAHTQAQVALSFRRWRGLGLFAGVGASRQLFESLWSDLFYNFDSEHEIIVTLRGSSTDHNRSVRVYYKEQQVITLPLEREGSPTSIALRPIVFEWTDASGQKGTSEVSLGAGGLAISQSGQPPIPGAFFNSFSIFDSPVENRERIEERTGDGWLPALTDCKPTGSEADLRCALLAARVRPLENNRPECD